MKTIEEKMNEAFKQSGENAYFGNGFKAGYKAALEWISVDEELPPEHENVLVKLSTDTVLMGIMDSSNEWGIYYSDGRNIEDTDRPVTHWKGIN